ncbi:hypothetical protein DY245_29995 [Streptomyces inhibens]|uniref:Uncharacterized protein n=1 Tax=Streptomyces inhibens TaxID=2293571 RepID=A0A371PWP8_STRIH|nr:hypothetical protein DY245_29995 [Streptomyces inhibens]
MEFRAAFPADVEAFEVVEQGVGLLDDVVELAHALDVRGALAGGDGQDSAFAQLFAVGVGVVVLPPSGASGRLRGRPGRPVTGGVPSTRARVWVTSLTLAVVSSASRMRWNWSKTPACCCRSRRR